MKRKNIHFHIQYIILLVIVFALPLKRSYMPPLLLLLSLNWIVEVLTDSFCLLICRLRKEQCNFIFKWKIIQQNNFTLPLFLYIGLFVFYTIGLVYSENMSFGKNDIVLKLPLLALPLIVFSYDLKKWTFVRIKTLFNFYFVGCFLAIAYNVYHSYINFTEYYNYAHFFYLLASFLHHPSYASMFYTFALAAIIYFLLNKKTTIIEKVLYFLCIPVLIAEIFLLSSKTAFLVLFVLFILLIIYIIFSKQIKKTNLLYIFFILLIGGGMYTYLPDNFNRFTKKIESIKGVEDIRNDGRYTIWRYAAQVAKENLPCGTGSGDVKDALKEKYLQKLELDYYVREYNCHNQYLQLLVTLGIFGCLLFIVGQVYSIVIAYKKKYFLYFVFTLIVGINFLTEAMLERQSGLVFFAVFNTLLFVFAYIETLNE